MYLRRLLGEQGRRCWIVLSISLNVTVLAVMVFVVLFWSLLSTPLLATLWHPLVMATQTKGNVLRLYVKDEDLEGLKAITEAVEISQTEVMSRIMTAGIRALHEAGNRLPLPLKFQIVEGVPEMPRIRPRKGIR